MLQARTFRAFETYFVVTLVYLGLSIGVRRLLIVFGRRTLVGGRAMIEFTLWDILRNLLLRRRAGPSCSRLAAFVGGASVGLAHPAAAHLEARRWPRRFAQGLHRALPGHAAADAALPDVLRPADARLPHRALDRRGRSASPSSPAPILAEIWRSGVDAHAARPVGRRRQPRPAPPPGSCASSSCRRPSPSPARRWSASSCSSIKSTALTSIIGFEELLRTANAINNATFRAVHRLRPRRGDLLRALLPADPLRPPPCRPARPAAR